MKLEDDLSPSEILILKDRLNQVDPLKLVANLIAIMADAPRAERHVKAYQTEKAAADRAKASLVEAKAKHDQHIADTTAELDASRASLRKRELEIVQREGRLQAAEARLKERDETEARRTGRLEVFHGGMTRERELIADEPDPHFGSA
jgi:chromosome segregation ATPase